MILLELKTDEIKKNNHKIKEILKLSNEDISKLKKN